MAEPGSWDLLDEDCSDISDWTDIDSGSAVSDVDPAGQFRFRTLATDTSNAHRWRDMGSTPNTITAEVKLYCDAPGSAPGDGHAVYMDIRQASDVFIAYWAESGMHVYNGGSFPEAGTDLVKYGGSVEWQIWRLLINYTTGKVDVYLTDSTHTAEKVGDQLDWSLGGTFNDGEIYLKLGDDPSLECHWDYVKVATGLYVPSVTSIKTVSGVAHANIKTINGVPIADVKSFLGVSNVS